MSSQRITPYVKALTFILLVTAVVVVGVLSTPASPKTVLSLDDPTRTPENIPEATISPGTPQEPWGALPLALPTYRTPPSVTETPPGGVTPVVPATPTTSS